MENNYDSNHNNLAKCKNKLEIVLFKVKSNEFLDLLIIIFLKKVKLLVAVVFRYKARNRLQKYHFRKL